MVEFPLVDLVTWSLLLSVTPNKFNCLRWKGLCRDSSHPCGDVVVKAVDKVHQFDSEQTHSVNLLIYRLFDLYFFTQSSLQFLCDICEIYRNKPLPILETLQGGSSIHMSKLFSKSSDNSYHWIGVCPNCIWPIWSAAGGETLDCRSSDTRSWSQCRQAREPSESKASKY